jgi:tetratricopeptide (TPR) repeat protein
MGERMLNKRFVNFITSSTWSIFVLATALCIVWLLAGCAGIQARPEPRWGCSPEADAAVEKGDWEAAREAHETLLDQTPDNCLALYHLGYIWGRLGSRDEEIAHYHKAEACGYVHDGQLYFNLGMALADINDIDGAIAAFEQAVALDPRNADHYFGWGLVAQADGRDDLAERVLLEAVDLMPRHREARLVLARIYLDQSRWADARAQLEAVIGQDADNPEARDLWQTMEARRRESRDDRRP